MKEKFLDSSVTFIGKYNNSYSDEQVERIRYGLEGLYLTVTKLVVILIISLIIGITKELIIMLIFFNVIRFPAFGVHADKSSTCLIVSILLILGLTIVLVNIKVNLCIKGIICTICFINYLLFAPADTIKRPLTNVKKRKIRKMASCVVAIVYVVLIFILKSWLLSNLIMTALIIEAIMINPLTYKILGMPYNNYKKIA